MEKKDAATAVGNTQSQEVVDVPSNLDFVKQVLKCDIELPWKVREPAGELPGDKEWPTEVRQALAGVLSARRQAKGIAYYELYYTGYLHDAAKAAAIPFLKICEQYLKEEGAETYSDTRISTLVRAYKYLVAKGFKVVSDLPKNLSEFPTYTQVACLYRFIKNPVRATAKKREWDALHGKVFDLKPEKRPSVSEINKAMNKLFAPPKTSTAPGVPPPAVKATIVKPEQLQDWYQAIAPDGQLAVAEIAITKMDAQTLATALESNWDSIKTAQIIRVRVEK